MGYGAPAAVGAALANKKYGRLSINIQTDGDLNYAPGVLWTAAHHRIPLLTIMHNNRGYHAEVMFVEQQASLHNRGADRAPHRHQAVGAEHQLRQDGAKPTECTAKVRSPIPKDLARGVQARHRSA